MFTFSVQTELKERFPSQVTAWFGPVPVSRAGELAGSLIGTLQTECRDTMTASNASDVAEIRWWKEVFQKMGASPKYHSSVEALFERYRATGALYTIDPVVDLYNWISLRCLTPMAAYDQAHIQGEVRLRYAKKGEAFTPLGNPKDTEKTKNGEVVYADEQKVICRYWNKQDCHDTRITPATESAVFFADLTNNEERRAEETIGRIAALLEAGLGYQVEQHLVM
jgi:DNA/RNA-binding domain of Phe-tRNA-synthetase-like protein